MSAFVEAFEMHEFVGTVRVSLLCGTEAQQHAANSGCCALSAEGAPPECRLSSTYDLPYNMPWYPLEKAGLPLMTWCWARV